MQKDLLQQVQNVQDLRQLEPGQLADLCADLRRFVQENSLAKPGHIRSSLGVAELTVALHYHFRTPEDILVWDVGHQAYVHKVLTDRKDVFHRIRQLGGISGFTSRKESPFDPFGAGHSSTSLSALAGFCHADRLAGRFRQRIAVIGDGALTGGMSFEALNYIGEQQYPCWIVLNDNRSSIDPNVGALQQRDSYRGLAASLGFQYYELDDGHSLPDLLALFREAQKDEAPRFLRISTEKGRGYKVPETKASAEEALSYQKVFGDTVVELLREEPRLVVLSPAMLSGGQLAEAQRLFPSRVLDVGIAEQHAVTMCASLAAEGYIPICHLYSTFAQRAIDQIIHDVALQDLPVLFALDRAGIAGQDGATHHGVFDISLLAGIPGLQLSAPASPAALDFHLRDAVRHRKLAALRFPKSSFTASAPGPGDSLEPQWWKKGRGQCVLSFGAVAEEVEKALEGSEAAHLHLPVLKPFPKGKLLSLLQAFTEVYTVEENAAAGGLGQQLAAAALERGVAWQWRGRSIPDAFVPHGSRAELLAHCEMDAASLRGLLRL